MSIVGSVDLEGGFDWAKLRRHYDNDDFVQIPLVPGVAETYYTVGYMAALNDPTVINPLNGWLPWTHGQPAAPAWLAAILAVLGVPWTAQVPAFEAKDILFYSDVDCWIRFGEATATNPAARVQHFIPADALRRYHRRCFIIFAAIDPAVAVPGTLNIDIEG